MVQETVSMHQTSSLVLKPIVKMHCSPERFYSSPHTGHVRTQTSDEVGLDIKWSLALQLPGAKLV